ncbi:MAG: hypothetical protein KF889_04875 [Alphaproteobacteria bacterium]|nr:hypothetical protein [Alphaproteobacteria bacterium]MCW5742202.1 hypothetical protein [Alphaproteobacteria bacterium]
MSELTAEQARSRLAVAKSRRQPFETEIAKCYEVTIPQGWCPNGIVRDRRDTNDSTATVGVQQLASTVTKYLVPMDRRWCEFDIVPLAREYGATGELEYVLAQSEGVFYAELLDSGFYSVVEESVTDSIICGVGAIGIEIEDDGLYFTALNISGLYFLDDGSSYIDTVFREYRLPARKVVEKYADECPSWIVELNEKTPDESVDLVEAMTPSGKRWEFSVWTAKGFERLHTKQCAYRPFIVFRFYRVSGQPYGDSPVRSCLGDINTLIQMVRDTMAAGERQARPSYTSNDPELRNMRIQPDMVHYMDPNSKLDMIPTGADVRLGTEMIVMQQTKVRQGLMVDVLPGSDRMTKGEVDLRSAQWFDRIGGAARRLEKELLEPLIRSVVMALQASGRMPDFPLGPESPVLLNIRALTTRVHQMQRFRETYEGVAMMKQLGGREAMQILDVPATNRFLWEQIVPPHLLKPAAQVEAELKAMQMGTAVAGGMAIANGQGNTEMAAEAGKAAANVGPDIMSMFGAAMGGEEPIE